MGSCLFERLSGLPSMASVCGNMLVEPGEQCDCGFPDVSPSPRALPHSLLCPHPGSSAISKPQEPLSPPPSLWGLHIDCWALAFICCVHPFGFRLWEGVRAGSQAQPALTLGPSVPSPIGLH